MFVPSQPRTFFGLLFNFLVVTFHASVRKVRKNHGNAILSVGLSIVQTAMFILAFYLMFSFMGMRTAPVRGNYIMYLMSGIFLYLTHIQTLRTVMMSEGPTSEMMQHAPMNTLVSICSSALSILYTKFVALCCILLIVHTVVEPIHIADPVGAFRMFILAWLSGAAFGIILMGMKPWLPDVTDILSQLYIRANMIFSGKMFVANALPALMLGAFFWNPLFHIIDQARGFVFENYFPHVTNTAYPTYFTLGALLFGMMLEAYTRIYASASWGAKR